jgi:hypothetical protein
MIDDPHWWNSVVNVEKATVLVRDELIKLDPASDSDAFSLSFTKVLACSVVRIVRSLPLCLIRHNQNPYRCLSGLEEARAENSTTQPSTMFNS